jgi:hypothetical protein
MQETEEQERVSLPPSLEQEKEANEETLPPSAEDETATEETPSESPIQETEKHDSLYSHVGRRDQPLDDRRSLSLDDRRYFYEGRRSRPHD